MAHLYISYALHSSAIVLRLRNEIGKESRRGTIDLLVRWSRGWNEYQNINCPSPHFFLYFGPILGNYKISAFNIDKTKVMHIHFGMMS